MTLGLLLGSLVAIPGREPFGIPRSCRAKAPPVTPAPAAESSRGIFFLLCVQGVQSDLFAFSFPALPSTCLQVQLNAGQLQYIRLAQPVSGTQVVQGQIQTLATNAQQVCDSTGLPPSLLP